MAWALACFLLTIVSTTSVVSGIPNGSTKGFPLPWIPLVLTMCFWRFAGWLAATGIDASPSVSLRTDASQHAVPKSMSFQDFTGCSLPSGNRRHAGGGAYGGKFTFRSGSGTHSPRGAVS